MADTLAPLVTSAYATRDEAAAILATITAATTAAARHRAELLAHLSDTLT
ncbi:hypothetical protein [Nocardia sp. NPDC051981]